MRTLHKISNHVPEKYAEQHYMSCLYPISDTLLQQIKKMLIPGCNAALFCGGRRFDWVDVNVEPHQYKGLMPQSDTKKTFFLDPSNVPILNLVLKKIAPANIVLLNTAIVLKYRHWTEILKDVRPIKAFTKQVIITLPFRRFDWNRCKYSPMEQAELMGASIVDQTFIVALK